MITTKDTVKTELHAVKPRQTISGDHGRNLHIILTKCAVQKISFWETLTANVI